MILGGYALPRCSQPACFCLKNTAICPRFAERICILSAPGSSRRKGGFVARRAWCSGSPRGCDTNGAASRPRGQDWFYGDWTINHARLDHLIPVAIHTILEQALDSSVFSPPRLWFLERARVVRGTHGFFCAYTISARLSSGATARNVRAASQPMPSRTCDTDCWRCHAMRPLAVSALLPRPLRSSAAFLAVLTLAASCVCRARERSACMPSKGWLLTPTLFST